MKRQSILTPKSAIGDPEPSAAGMVERVALVLAAELGIPRDATTEDVFAGRARHSAGYLTAAARAAIAAMREPTREQLAVFDDYELPYIAREAYVAAIDAALAEDTSGRSS